MTKIKTRNERIHIDLANLINEKHMETGIPKTIVSQKFAQELRNPSYKSTGYKPILPSVAEMNPFKKKRGAMADVIFILIGLFAFALFLLFVFFMQQQVFSGLIPAFENVTAGSSAPLTTLTTVFTGSLNYLYLAFFFSLLIGLIVTAYLTPTHPVFFPVAVILLIALVAVSAIVSNIYESIASTSALQSTSNVLNIVGWLMSNLPIVITVVGVLAIIVLFSKTAFSGGGFAQTG